MKILRIPTYWSAKQAVTVHELLGELQAAIWQAYHKDIKQIYKGVETENQADNLRQFDDDIEF